MNVLDAFTINPLLNVSCAVDVNDVPRSTRFQLIFPLFLVTTTWSPVTSFDEVAMDAGIARFAPVDPTTVDDAACVAVASWTHPCKMLVAFAHPAVESDCASPSVTTVLLAAPVQYVGVKFD